MKKRLDELVCLSRPDLSRTQAQRLIMSGVVYVNNQKELKSGSMFAGDVKVEVRENRLRYVSRGGLKLEKALKTFSIDLSGRICIDIGSSTGGFTDCMLQNGAVRVYAVDSGTGQLHYKLRNDERVVVMERRNIRYVTTGDIKESCAFASVDVSFISLSLVLPAALPLLDDGKELVMLIKPQFEAGREKVGKKGVVRDPGVHAEVIRKIADLAESSGLGVYGLTYSPVKGPEGNIEYLIHVGSGTAEPIRDKLIKNVVGEAHRELDR